MTMKKRIALLLCIVLAFSASGCTGTPDLTIRTASTLPPAQAQYAAPVSDALMEHTQPVALYLPARDGQRLLCQYEHLTLSHNQHAAEAVVRALITHPGNASMRPLGDGVAISLYGQNPVETANGVCTVNLSASVLQLDLDDFYTVCLSLATTLCELPDIHAVNVLVADQAVGMDISSILPLGCLTAHPGESLPALWEQLLARRTPLGENPATVPTSASAALYFPLSDGSGVIPETHTLSFPGQTPQQLAEVLLSALSSGAQYTAGTADMPNIASLLVYAPSASDLEGGGRLLTLRFIGDLEDRLAAAGVDMTCFVASVAQTLLTFIPSIAAVDIYVGTTPLCSLYHDRVGSLLFDEGRVRRNAFSALLMDQVTLLLPCGDGLTAVQRAVRSSGAASPRTLVSLLFDGASPLDAALGCTSPAPAGLLGSDILGVTITGDTLLLNLSSRCAEAIRAMDDRSEQLLCYSIVNTLCAEKGVRRVLFFFDGAMAESLGGSLYWGGEFMASPALINQQ